MTDRTFPFAIDLWMNNRALRACSPAARGFWVDLLCMCHPTGYLPTLTDKQIARAIGETPASVRKWLAELGQAGIFHVSDDDRLYSSRMVKAALSEADRQQTISEHRRSFSDAPEGGEFGGALSAPAVPRTEPTPSPAVPARSAMPSADWWLTPAGWSRMGAQQALTMKPGEAYEDFQCRVAARLPPGRHLDALTRGQLMRVEALTPKQP